MCICICVCACMCVPVINYDNEMKKLYSPFGCSNFIKVLKVTMFCCLRQLIHVKLKTSLQMLKQNVVKQCRSKQLLYSMFDKSFFFSCFLFYAVKGIFVEYWHIWDYTEENQATHLVKYMI